MLICLGLHLWNPILKADEDVAHIARKYDRGYGHFTTGKIQYNWPALDRILDLLEELRVEMHAIQSQEIVFGM